MAKNEIEQDGHWNIGRRSGGRHHRRVSRAQIGPPQSKAASERV